MDLVTFVVLIVLLNYVFTYASILAPDCSIVGHLFLICVLHICMYRCVDCIYIHNSQNVYWSISAYFNSLFVSARDKSSHPSVQVWGSAFPRSLPPPYPPQCLFIRTSASGALGGVVLGPDHHLHRLEGLPVIGGVVLRGHVVPGAPEDAVAHALVVLVVVLAVEVGRHAGVEPPARAVVGAAVAGGVHVVVAVGRGEELLVVVELLVEHEGVACRAAEMVNGRQ